MNRFGILFDFLFVFFQVLIVAGCLAESKKSLYNETKPALNEIENIAKQILDISDEDNFVNILEKANDYSISPTTDMKNVLVDGGKKYRILKVTRKGDTGENDIKSDGIRNIKLIVDGKGRRKVPNLFKTKHRAYNPYLTRRKNRQIYRGDYTKLHPQKSHVSNLTGE